MATLGNLQLSRPSASSEEPSDEKLSAESEPLGCDRGVVRALGQFVTNCRRTQNDQNDINEKTNQSIDWREHLKLAVSAQGLLGQRRSA